MRRVIFIIVAVAIAVLLAWEIAGLPGRVSLAGFGYSLDAATPVAVLAGALLILVLLLLLRGALFLLALPRLFGRSNRERRRRSGDTATGRALTALAAGDSRAATRQSTRARASLGDTPQTLLLSAESARLAGNLAIAEAHYQTLAARPDGAFLGLRGLFRLAIDREDWQEAAALARRAEALQPAGTWLREARLRLAQATGNWSHALSLAGPDLPAGLIATAAASGEADPQAAARLARQAWKANPSFPPAVLAHAAALRREGHDRAAEDAIRAAWKTAPHPDLAAFLLDDLPDPKSRLRAAIRLSNVNAEHLETQLLLGRLSLAAGEIKEARYHAERARTLAEPTRRIFLLLADIAAAERADPAPMLRAAALAPPDPGWHCGNCGTALLAWQPVCPACHAPARITWGNQGRRLLIAEG